MKDTATTSYRDFLNPDIKWDGSYTTTDCNTNTYTTMIPTSLKILRINKKIVLYYIKDSTIYYSVIEENTEAKELFFKQTNNIENLLK